VTLQTQAFTIAMMFCSGFLLGVILDTYHVLRIRFRLRGWVVSLIDLLYWLVAAGLVFGLLMWSNWGQLRFFIFIAILVGFYLYFEWLSQFVTRTVRWLVLWIEKVIDWIVVLLYYLLWIPLMTIGTFLLQMVKGQYRLIVIVGKGLLKLLIPIRWLFSPLLKWTCPIYKRCKNWWNKFRKKG
jgi:spore cortex biosynthesis protein YabQ